MVLTMFFISLTIYLSCVLPEGTQRHQNLIDYQSNFTALAAADTANCRDNSRDDHSTWFYGADFI
jgi:hypothetical protein